MAGTISTAAAGAVSDAGAKNCATSDWPPATWMVLRAGWIGALITSARGRARRLRLCRNGRSHLGRRGIRRRLGAGRRRRGRRRRRGGCGAAAGRLDGLALDLRDVVAGLEIGRGPRLGVVGPEIQP